MHEVLLGEYANDSRTYDKISCRQIVLSDTENEYQVSLLQSYYRWRRSIVNKGYDVDSNRHRQLAYFGLWKIRVLARYFYTLQKHANERKKQRRKAEWFYKKLLAQKTFIVLISHSLNNKVIMEEDMVKNIENEPQVRNNHSTIWMSEKRFPKYILTMGAWIEALQDKAKTYHERKLLVKVFHLLWMYLYCAKISSSCSHKTTYIVSPRMIPNRHIQKTYYETSVETIAPVISFDQFAYRSQRTQITLLWRLWIRGVEDIRECKYLWASSWKQLRNRIHNYQDSPRQQIPLKSSWMKPAVQRRQKYILQRWMDLRQSYTKQNVWNRMKIVLLDKDFNHRLAKRIHYLYLVRMGFKALYQYAFVKMPKTFILNEDETAIRYADEIDQQKRKAKYFAFWREITKMHKEKRQFAMQSVQKQRNLFLWTKAKWALQHYIIHIRYSEQEIMSRVKQRIESEVFRIFQSYYKFRSNCDSTIAAKVSRSFLRVGGRYDVRRTIGIFIHVFHFSIHNIGKTQKHSNYIHLWNKLLLESSTWRALKMYHLKRICRGVIFSSLMLLLSDDLKRLSFLEWRTFAHTQQRRRRLYMKAVEWNQSCIMNRMFMTWRKNAQWFVAERQATQVAVEFSRHKELCYWLPKWRKCVAYRKQAKAQISNKRKSLMLRLCFMLWRVETLVGIYSQKSQQRPVRRVFRALQQIMLEESKQRKAMLMNQLKSNRTFETHLRRMMDGATFCVYRNSPCRRTDVLFYLDEHLEFLYSTRKEFCFSLASLLELEYGASSSSYLEYLRQGGNLAHESWQCFSIFLRNKKEALCLATDNERLLESWFQGLLHIMGILQRKTRTFSFKAMRGRMKLRKLCEQRNCSLARILLSTKVVPSSMEYSTVSEAPLDNNLSQATSFTCKEDRQELHYKVIAQPLSSPELLIEELNEQLFKKNNIQKQGPVSFYLESNRIQTNPCNKCQADEIQSWLQADARILKVTVQCDIVPVPEPFVIVEEDQVSPLPWPPSEDLTPLPEDEPISLALSKTVSYIKSGRIPSLVPFARVRLVVPGSPSNAAGLTQDDYILSLGRLRFYRDSRGIPFVVGCNITLENIARWVEKECYQHENTTLQLVVLRRLEYYPEDSEVIEEWRTFRLQLIPKASPRYHGLLGVTFDFEVLKQQFQEPSKNIPFAMVTSVQPGSPAAEAGFLPNDLIVEYGSICFSPQDDYENAQKLVQESFHAGTEEAIVVVVLRPYESSAENDYVAPLCMYRLLITPNLLWQGIYGMQWSFYLAPGVIGYLDNGETVYHTSRWLWAKWMLKTIKKVKVLLKPEDDVVTRCRVFAEFVQQIAADKKLAGLVRVYKKVEQYASFQCPLPCYELFCKYIRNNEYMELVTRQKKESSTSDSVESTNKKSSETKRWKRRK